MTISVSDTTFSYEKESVLENIAFSIKEGEFVGIFGPNGGGKTTLLQLLLGFLTPQKGKIYIMGQLPHVARTSIGYVPQFKRFDREFPITVMEIVLQGCLSKYRYLRGFSKEEKHTALEALEKVGMKGHAQDFFGTLSGGQIQRVLIARALASNPKILLLDEATAGIDPSALQEIFTLLLTLRGSITILLVTHELQNIAREMHRLLCINRTLTFYRTEEVCAHFAMGLYHPPINGKKNV